MFFIDPSGSYLKKLTLVVEGIVSKNFGTEVMITMR